MDCTNQKDSAVSGLYNPYDELEMQPTQVAYTELETAYDFFNTQLFNGELPGALLTLQRDKRSYGYFESERFANGNGERSDEIAMNPLFFAVIPAVEIMQTLAHEMVHQWQFHFGTPGRRGYHNREWAAKMEEVGLMPSDTGEPGGKKVGEKMADYVISGGKFETAYCELVGTQFAITWKDRLPSVDGIKNVMAGEVEGIEPLSLDALGVTLHRPESKSTRRKYSCAPCEVNVWGKPGLNLLCGDCQTPFADVGL